MGLALVRLISTNAPTTRARLPPGAMGYRLPGQRNTVASALSDLTNRPFGPIAVPRARRAVTEQSADSGRAAAARNDQQGPLARRTSDVVGRQIIKMGSIDLTRSATTP